MKKKWLIILLVLVVAALGGWYWYHNYFGGYGSPVHHHTTNISNTPAVATSSVSIQNYEFSPDNITIKKGTTVTWTNQDPVGQTVTETDGKTGPSSGVINPNQTYTFTYNQAGQFDYHCSIHPEMVGSVTVTQ